VRVTSASDPDRDRFRDWPTPARYTVYGVAGVVLLLVLALIAAAIVVRRPLPQTTGDLRLDGLDDTVQVRRDGQGVPQIYAGTSHDLFYAQGFVQAQDRFWQMDYRRHLSAGRLSELFGARTVSSDMTARTLGWYRTAEREEQLCRPRPARRSSRTATASTRGCPRTPARGRRWSTRCCRSTSTTDPSPGRRSTRWPG
jgi:penicillin amidase